MEEAGELPDIFGELHYSVQQQILSFLDSRTLSHVSCTCRELRGLALGIMQRIRVPGTVTPKQLLAFPQAILPLFPSATQLVLQGDLSHLRPAEVDQFIRERPPCMARITRLVISEVELTGPLAVATVTAMCNIWSQLREVTLHDTRLTCPLECTEPVVVDNLLRRLLDMEGQPLPHMTVLRQLVNTHETRLEANLLVTLKVFEALSRLPHLTHATITSRYMHVHNAAVAALGRCTALTHLTLKLTDEWPTVTVHGLQQLSPSVKALRLITNRPLQAWSCLAALTNPSEAGPSSPGTKANDSPSWHTSPPHLQGRPAASHSSGSSTHHHYPYHDQGLPSAAMGRCMELHLEGVLSNPQQILPAGGLPRLPALCSLKVRSSCVEAPEPEDPDEVVPDNPKEVAEATALRAMMAAAPGLHALELSNAGPVLTRTLVQLADKVPSHQLLLQCHSRVDVRPLLAAHTLAQLSLVLKGVSATQLQELVEAACSSHTHSSDPSVAHSSGPSQAHSSTPSQATAQGSALGSIHSTQGTTQGATQGTSQATSNPQGTIQGTIQGTSQGSRLASLHFQRSHELTDTLLAQALAALTSVTHLTVTTCRNITCDLVVEAARLRRPIRLRVAGCRLVLARGWEAAVLAARDVQGCKLVDVKYPSEDDLGNEVAFE